MWHQFGRMPKDKEGVFLSVDDIPKTWLQYHYDVVEFDSPYNVGVSSRVAKENLHKNVKSLADLVGFNKNQKAKLGQIKNSTIIREAIVAIPYITDNSEFSPELKKKFMKFVDG